MDHGTQQFWRLKTHGELSLSYGEVWKPLNTYFCKQPLQNALFALVCVAFCLKTTASVVAATNRDSFNDFISVETNELGLRARGTEGITERKTDALLFFVF